MPRSRNTYIRPKNTSRAEARRRHRDEQRATEDDPNEVDETAEQAEEAQPQRRSMFQMPDVLGDVKALPQVFRKPLVWLPFGLLAATFVLAFALIEGMLEDLPPMAVDGISLYISLTLHPTSLFIFFIGGFFAPRASYIVGGILGVLSAVIYLTIVSLASDVARETYAQTLVATTEGEIFTVSSDLILQTLGMGLFIGVFAGGFAAWYRGFLRSSQQRAAANRAQKEREQADKAKDQARSDRETLRAQKYADREARRKGNS